KVAPQWDGYGSEQNQKYDARKVAPLPAIPKPTCNDFGYSGNHVGQDGGAIAANKLHRGRWNFRTSPITIDGTAIAARVEILEHVVRSVAAQRRAPDMRGMDQPWRGHNQRSDAGQRHVQCSLRPSPRSKRINQQSRRDQGGCGAREPRRAEQYSCGNTKRVPFSPHKKRQAGNQKSQVE